MHAFIMEQAKNVCLCYGVRQLFMTALCSKLALPVLWSESNTFAFIME